MEYIVSDFVNRTEQLNLLWQMARQETEPRILIVEAPFGMGKSYLIKEFRAECEEDGIELVCLDFEEKYEDPGYMYIVKEIWSQLGPTGFELLGETLQETGRKSTKERIFEEFQSFQAGREDGASAPGANGNEGDQTAGTAGAPPERDAAGQTGGVNIYGGKNTFRDVAGRDIIHLVQILQMDDPYVQEKARVWITDVLERCLLQVAAERRLIFLIDNWQKADGDTRKWLASSLVKWTADARLPKANIMIAGDGVQDVAPRKRIRKIILPELEEQDAHSYLVDKCGLPIEAIADILRVAGGNPLMLVLASARRKRTNLFRTEMSS
jgi:hypothetical protein